MEIDGIPLSVRARGGVVVVSPERVRDLFRLPRLDRALAIRSADHLGVRVYAGLLGVRLFRLA